VVVRVDPEERDALAELRRGVLEDRELRPAGPAPGSPLVHHDGVPAERIDLPLERLRRAADDRVALAIDSGQRRRRALQRLAHLRERQPVGRLLLAARLREAENDDAGHDQGYNGYDKASHVVWMIPDRCW